MRDTRSLLAGAQRNFHPPDDAFDRLLGRQTRRSRNRRLAATALGLVVVIGTGVGLGRLLVTRGPDGTPAQQPEERRFTSADLPGMVLGADEAPSGTELTREVRGQAVLARTPTDANEIVRSGFVDAYRTEFQEPGAGAVDPGTVYINSAAILFEDASAATRGLAITAAEHRLGTQRGDAEPPAVIPARGLGEESFGFEGRWVPFSPNRQISIIWRRGNVLFHVYGESLDPETLLEIAREMDARAALRG